MKRSFKSFDLVALPQLDVANLIALVVAILAVAKAIRGLPKGIVAALRALATAHETLYDAASHQRPTRADPARAKVADVFVDSSWRALEGFLSALMTIPGSPPEAALAETVHTALFPDGLRFTQLPFRAQWAECATRLRQMERDGLGDIVTKLGGAAFLRAIEKGQADYGAALGLTEPADTVTVSLREPAEAVFTSLRNFVVLVTANAIEGTIDPEIADKLVKPIVEWPTPRARSIPDEPLPAPAPEPAPNGSPNGESGRVAPPTA